jgi:hypothetical protein
MNLLPRPAQLVQTIDQNLQYPADLTARESVVLPQFQRSSWAVQIDYGLVIGSDDVNVSWAMIVRIDYDAKAAKPENCRHESIVLPKRLGFWRLVNIRCRKFCREWVALQ